MRCSLQYVCCFLYFLQQVDCAVQKEGAEIGVGISRQNNRSDRWSGLKGVAKSCLLFFGVFWIIWFVGDQIGE
jgi:hypothetical protein